MSRRFWLVSISVAAHLAVGITMFVTGVWRIERLEADDRLVDLAVQAPPAPSGSPEGLPEQKLIPKEKKEKTIAKDPHQPEVKPVEPPEPTTAAGETGNGLGDGKGDGNNPNGDEHDTGTCLTPPCGDAPAAVVTMPERPKIPPPTRFVPPTVMQHMRISGSTQIHPSLVVKNQMRNAGKSRATAVLKVCVSARGTISSVQVLRSTKYPEFDATLAAGVRGWRYRPYTVGGQPVPVCGMVNFIYTMK